MKPKENIIAKIDSVFDKIYSSKSLQMFKDENILEDLRKLQNHLHTTNIHKAKVTYFSNVKTKVNVIWELLKSTQTNENVFKTKKQDMIEALEDLKRYLRK
jgi:hypothetical protein